MTKIQVSAWKHCGGHHRTKRYGFRIKKADQQKHFSEYEDDEMVTLVLPVASSHTGGEVQVNMRKSFKAGCSHLDSMEITEWLWATDAAPWKNGDTPKFTLTIEKYGRFIISA